MALLGCPAEIFQRIIHDLVSEAGVDEAWELRRVCRTFAAEIYHDVFANQPMDAILYYYLAIRIIESNLGLYLLNRTKRLLGVNPSLPNRINDMVEFLAQELGLTSHNQRQQLTEEICIGIVKTMGRAKVEYFLWGLYPARWDMSWDRFTRTPISSLFGAPEKLTAAVAGNSLHLVQKLLPQLSETVTAQGFNDPLEMAVVLGRKDIVTAILDYLRTPGLKTSRKFLTSPDQGFSFSSAIVRAIRAKDLDMLHALVTAHEECLGPAPNRAYHLWLGTAIEKSRNMDVINTILDMKIIRQPRISLANMYSACTSRNPDIVAAMFAKNRLSPNKQYAETSPLLVALCKAEHVPSIRVILDAGADINSPVLFGRSGGKRTPLEWALHHNVYEEAIQLLLDRGTGLPAQSAWPQYRDQYNILRQEAIKRGFKNVPRFLESKALGLSKLGYGRK